MLYKQLVWMWNLDRSHSRSALVMVCSFFFQAEDGIRDLVRSRGLGDVYKRQRQVHVLARAQLAAVTHAALQPVVLHGQHLQVDELSLIHI